MDAEPRSEAPAALEVERPVSCEAVSIHCGRAPSLAYDPAGRLWGAFEHEGIVYVSLSLDDGHHFSTPRPVNHVAEAVEVSGENRPKIISTKDRLYVSWTTKLPGRFTGEIRFSRSLDESESFDPVRTINDDGLQVGHRFESLAVDERGHVYLVWIDKRDATAARQADTVYRGAAIYYAVSTDHGATFSPNVKLLDHACECCRIATAQASGGGIAVLWRHIFEPSTRDHAFALLGPEGVQTEPRRASFEDWELEGCPHHGPAMVPAAGNQPAFHMTWFSAAENQPQLYFTTYIPGGASRPPQLVEAGPTAAHPNLAAIGDRLWLTWKEVAGRTSTIWIQSSEDAGLSWSDPTPLARAVGNNDHPFLISNKKSVRLSWFSATSGLRVIPVGP